MSSWFPATTTAALLSTPLVVIIFIVGHMAVTAPSVPCPTGCVCSEDEPRLLTAKCSLNTFAVDPAEDFFAIQILSFNNSDTTVPISLKDDMFQAFSGLTNIELSNCSVGYIHPGVFKGLKFLRDLDLSNNHITHFHRASFFSTPKLSYLNLNNNPIELTDSFLSSRYLEELELESCSIQHIPTGAFKGLVKLKRLSLYNNSIDSIPAHTLPRGLKRLNIARNHLVNVPTEVIYNLNRIRSLDLSENLINCSCKLMGLQDWLSGRGVTFENDVLCASPPKYNGKSWSTVNEDEICDKEIRMTKEFNNHHFGDSASVDSECDDMKASCDELGEILQADQPLVNQESENTIENGQTPNDDPAVMENSEGAPVTDVTEEMNALQEDNSPKETENESEEKVAEEEVKPDQDSSQDPEPTDEEVETDKSVTEENLDLTKDVTDEENSMNETEEKDDLSSEKETANHMVGEGLTAADAKVNEDSTPSTVDQGEVAELGTAAMSNIDNTPAESTSFSPLEKVDGDEESTTNVSGDAAEGQSLSVPATESSSNAEQGHSTNLPEAVPDTSVSSSAAPAEVENTESTTVEKAETEEELNTSSPHPSIAESSPSSEAAPEIGESLETSSIEPTTDVVTSDNIPAISYETTVSNSPLSSSESPKTSASPEETTIIASEVGVSTVSPSMASETVSSFPEVSSSPPTENVKMTTPETDVFVTTPYTSSSETPSSNEMTDSSSTTENNLEIGKDISSQESSSSPSISESVASVVTDASQETPSSPAPVLSSVNVDGSTFDFTTEVLPNPQEPILDSSTVIAGIKENPGAYVLGGIVFLLAVLLLIALSRCRQVPQKKRREPKYDSDMNGGTELQEITSLIPSSMTNGTKIFNNKYPNEKPSKDTMNLLSSGEEKAGNNAIIPLHSDANGTASSIESPWANGTTANGKSCNGTTGKLDSSGSAVSMVDRGSQFFDDGLNPPIELTKVKVMMLPDSVPKTPVFVHRKYGNENS